MQQELPDRFQLYRFKLDRILGKGGTGTVYRGIDTKDGSVVAVKLFRANFFRNRLHMHDLAKSVSRFKSFDHPNVVRVFEFIAGKEGPCLIEEFVDGPDLKWYLDNRTWNLQERLVIVAQICNGLQYIHDQGFVHHDLKPGNILFTRKGVVKVCDYSLGSTGLLTLLDGNLPEQITPMYVAPELLNKQKASPKSDMYALGVTLYLLFTGKVPFEVDSLQKLYFCHLRIRPEHPSVVNPKCPAILGDIIMRLLEKEPKNRFENCDQLRITLSDVGKSRI